MNTMEKIVEGVQALPETDAREVLDFVGFLKAKRAKAKAATLGMSEFDQFGAVYERGEASEPEHEIDLALFRQYRGLYDGKFNREECYDRAGLR